MIIAASKEGQLCNRLFHICHFIANAWGNNHELHYLFFEEYIHLFNANLTDNLKGNRIFIRTPIISRIGLFLLARFTPNTLKNNPFYKVIRSKNEVNLNDPSIVKDAKKHRLLTFGWLFRDSYNFEKYQTQLRALFDFTENIKEATANKIASFKSSAKNPLLVGVHIRRGDYEQYLDGKYFFRMRYI